MRTISALVAWLFAVCAFAQTYPDRPVKVIVPWPAGQAIDIVTRVVAEKLQQQLGQPFVIDNRPGAGGAIGTEAAAKSAPDGYTLLAASSGPISIMPNLQKVPYDPLKDLAPISLVARAAFALVTHPSFPAADAKELVALLRANPGKYTFASSGTGATAHLFAELFNSLAGIQARHVPYKGSAAALTDVMNGQVSYAIETVAATAAHVKAGRLKAYGVSTLRRAHALPEIPALGEATGLSYDAAAWGGYAAPAGTPPELLERIASEIRKAMHSGDVKERFAGLGFEPISTTPEEMGAYLRREQERYATIIRNANIKVEQ